MNRSVVYTIVAVLLIAVGALSYSLYQEQQKKSGVEISVGNKGIAIETK